MKIELTQFIPKFIWNKIQPRENLAKIINNSGWLILEKFVRGMLALLVGAWVARYLGPSDYGKYSFVLAYLAFFQVLSNMGMDGIVVRDIAQIQTNHKFDGDSSKNSVNSTRIRSKISKILGTAFAIRLIVGSASWVLAVVIIGMIYRWKSQLVQLIFIGGGALIFQAADTIDLWFQSQSKSKSTVLAKFIAYIFSNGLKIVLIIGEFPLIYFCSVLFIEAAICAASLIFIFQKYSYGYSIWSSDFRSQGFLLIRQSWPFILTGLGIVTYMKIDQIYIKELLSVSDLGIYSAAVTIAAIGYFIPGIICTSLMPFIAAKKIVNEEEYINGLRKIYKFMLVIAICLSIFLILFSSLIINFMYGNAYSEGSLIISIYALTNIPVFLGVTHGLWIINDRKYLISIYRTIGGGSVAFFGCYLLIPVYGIKGAAFAALLAFTTSDIIIPILLNYKFFRSILIK